MGIVVGGGGVLVLAVVGLVILKVVRLEEKVIELLNRGELEDYDY